MTTDLPQMRLTFASEEAMQAEYRRNLRAGGAFCPGAQLHPERTACLLVLVHPASGEQLKLAAEVVFVKPDNPGQGVGVQISDFGPAIQEQLRAFMHTPQPTTPPPDNTESPTQKLASATLHERLRALNTTAQLRLAREGSLPERVALERIFGKAVWEAILQNQRVTPPEVARIARMGTASVAILDTIVGNAGWLASSEVRRALLSHPRLGEEATMKVLRAMPKAELHQICNLTYYPPRVRKAAKGMLAHV